MMFIVRTERPLPPDVQVKMQRRTPSLAGEAHTTDFFCVGDQDAVRAAGLTVIPVHDGWYADDAGGGVAIFGQGRFWEVRDTPFSIKEADAAVATTGTAHTGSDIVNVRGAIFGV
jgi:hypothetical protein